MAEPAAPHPVEDFVPILSPRQQWLAGFVLALSNFMVVLDLTIANVSVPHIAGNLGISLDQGTWIITSYAVAEAVCVPLTGWLASRFGSARVFIIAMGGFGLFSLLCGIAPTLGVLVAARIGQGLFGAPLMPMSQTLMVLVFPPERRGKFMALWAMTTLMGPALGPILGGWISDNWSWHWIFLINVPIALGAAIAAGVLLAKIRTPIVRAPIDKVGLGLLVFWIACLQIVLDTGRDHDWFADTRIVLLSLASAVGFVVFVIWELTEEHPVVDLRIFRHVGFSSSVFTMTIGYGAFFSGNVVIPQWLQAVQGYSAQNSGLVTASAAVAALIIAPLAAKLNGSGKVDLRLLVGFGLVWIAFTTLLRATWSTEGTMLSYTETVFLQGFGMPFFFISITTMVMNSVDPEETASGAGLQAFLRTMATAISTSLVLTYWSNTQRVVHNEMADTLNPAAAESTLRGLGIGTEGISAYLNGLVDQQAITVALDSTSVVAALCLLASAAVLWIAPKPEMRQGGIPMGH
ncbi:DHA2 family efflux MFS transporter permease subunit [Novosphingobium piscinae]|uniref:DHA2 family efflux MFS transporter permease subunit n=1 Tax=Novosphingobium piscinae TaxID=1507448 RepID=A0A7X1G0H6_9SPHN|nr:DHA2 family efflux MFS transporter permease subunit [Novosphingobium piscinae]MBC2670371.1 DHA2 family efflux MFS transporter permease subunit [Novosphingobium piscinae]